MTKEQYLAIRASWKQYIKDGKHKKYKVEYGHNWSYGGKSLDQGGEVAGYRWESDLSVYHHYIYTLLRKKDVKNAFSEECIGGVESHFNWLRHHWDNPDVSRKSHRDLLVIPFGGQLTDEMLQELLQPIQS